MLKNRKFIAYALVVATTVAATLSFYFWQVANSANLNVEGKKVVLESTDGFTGFINDKNEVKAYLTDFEKESKKNPLYLNPEQQLVQNLLQPAIFRAINLQQLKGLELFNRAIFYNNQKEYDIAFKKIKEAETLYPSERISALSRLLQSQLVVASNL